MSFKILILAICSPILVQGLRSSEAFRVGSEILNDYENLDSVFERSRELLSSDEKEFLEEILAADDAIMERQKRGIVDQILATLSAAGTGSAILGPRVTAVQNPSAATAPVAAKADTTNCGTPCTTNSDGNKAGASGVSATMQMPAAAAESNNDNYLFGQIGKVVLNSATRNVTGIVDEALKIGTPAPVRDLVNGILSVAYCNGIRRLLGRC